MSIREHWIQNVALKHQGDACLEWPFCVRGGRRGEGGYPALDGTYGHIRLCELAHGPRTTPKHEVEHLCGKRRCMNPEHVQWTTHRVNCARRTDHGTQTIGVKHPQAILSEADVRAIRAASRHRGSGRELARHYGVTPSTICVVRAGRSWRHIDAVAGNAAPRGET